VDLLAGIIAECAGVCIAGFSPVLTVDLCDLRIALIDVYSYRGMAYS
jgi:hypothetical protein